MIRTLSNHLDSLLKKLGVENISGIIKGSTVMMLAKYLAVFLGFISSMVINWHYGTSTLGLIATFASLLQILVIFSVLGNQTLLVKLLPVYVENKQKTAALQLIKKITLLTAITALIVLTLFHTLRIFFDIRLLEQTKGYHVLISVLLVVTAYSRITKFILRGFGDFKLFSLLETVPAFITLPIVFLSIAVGLHEYEFMHAHYLASLITLILGIYLFKTQSKKILRQASEITKPEALSAIILTSIPMFGTSLGSIVINNSDILILSHFHDKETVGIYSIYAKLAGVMMVLITGINAMFATRVSGLYSQGKIEEMRKVVKNTTLYSFTISACIATVLLIFSGPFLSLYGPDFNEHKSAMYVLIFATLINAFFGSTGIFMNMTNQHQRFFIIMGFAALVNIFLNILLVPTYGMMGAALTTLATIIIWNSISSYFIYRKFGYVLFTVKLHR